MRDKLFNFLKTENRGKVAYYNIGPEMTDRENAIYNEVDEEIEFDKNFMDYLTNKNGVGMQQNNLTIFTLAIMALFNETEDLNFRKYVYNRAGSGTDKDGFEYFDLKANTEDADHLKAIRYYFDGGTIKRIAFASYLKNSQIDELQGVSTVIEVEEFNANPDPKYFKLPKNFKGIKKAIPNPYMEKSAQMREQVLE